MTYEEFRSEVLLELKNVIKDDEYISKLDDNIKRYYDSAIEVGKFLGSNQLSVSGYVYGITMLYPDLP